MVGHVNQKPLRGLPQRLPPLLLALLILMHTLLAWAFHQHRGFFPSPIPHSGYTLIVDQVQVLRGHRPIASGARLNLGRKAVFDGAPAQHREDPPGLWQDLSRGQLRGVWRNHHEQLYWNGIPLPLFISALVHAAFGGNLTAVALTPQIFLALLLLGVYGMGKQAGGPWIGLAAAAIASGYPGLYEMSRTHHDALACSAIALLLVYFLRRCDGFSRPGLSALAGVLALLASRVGESISSAVLIGLVALGPFLLAVSRLVRKFDTQSSRSWRSLVGVALFIAPPWLLIQWKRLPSIWAFMGSNQLDVGLDAKIGAHVPQALAGVAAHLAYLFQIAFDLLQPLMTLWLIAGAVLLWRAPRGHRLAVLLMVAVPLVPLSLIHKKATWYILPALPALALMTALGLRGLRSSRARQWALGLAAACGVATPVFATLTPAALKQSVDLDRISPAIKRTAVVNGVNGPVLNWHGDPAAARKLSAAAHELIARVRRSAPLGPKPLRVAVFGVTTPQVEGFRYLLELSQPGLFVVDPVSPFMLPKVRAKVLARLAQMPVHYLIYLGRDRLLPHPPGSWDPLKTREEWHRPEGHGGHEEGPRAKIRRTVSGLRGRRWARVDLASGPIYEASR